MWAELAAIVVTGTSLLVFTMVRREKTSPKRALEQRIRARLVKLIEKKPGIRLSSLWRAVGVSRTTVQYHLAVLARTGAVEADLQKGTSRYYAGNGIKEDATAISLLRRGRILELVAGVLDRPGSCQRELTRKLRMRRNLFRKYANLLVKLELVSEKRDQNRQRYFPTPRLQHVLQLVNHYDQADLDSDHGLPGENS